MFIADANVGLGLFPGPTIESRSGDTLVVNVTNDLKDEDIAIHWHGLHIKSKPLHRTGFKRENILHVDKTL